MEYKKEVKDEGREGREEERKRGKKSGLDV